MSYRSSERMQSRSRMNAKSRLRILASYQRSNNEQRITFSEERNLSNRLQRLNGRTKSHGGRRSLRYRLPLSKPRVQAIKSKLMEIPLHCANRRPGLSRKQSKRASKLQPRKNRFSTKLSMSSVQPLNRSTHILCQLKASFITEICRLSPSLLTLLSELAMARLGGILRRSLRLQENL